MLKKFLIGLGIIGVIGLVINAISTDTKENAPTVLRMEENGQVTYYTSSFEKGKELEAQGYAVIYRPEEELAQFEDELYEIMNSPLSANEVYDTGDWDAEYQELETQQDQQPELEMMPEDSSEYYDYLISEGDGLKLVVKAEESLTEVAASIGVLNQNYEWVMPLSTDNPLSEQLNDGSNIEDRCEYLAGQTKYTGDGVFVIGEEEQASSVNHNYVAESAILLNINTQSWIDIGAYESHQSICFVDGYYVAVEPKTYRVKVITPVSEPYLLDIEFSIWYNHKEDYLGKYAEGLFFARPEPDKAGFYDIEGKKVIDLDEYAELLTFEINIGKNWEYVQPYFENGTATLKAKNSQGTRYVAVIDQEGNFISEFTEEQ